jgi:hypothetical protein
MNLPDVRAIRLPETSPISSLSVQPFAMNDPGTAKVINEMEGEIKDREQNDQGTEEEEEVLNFLDPG